MSKGRGQLPSTPGHRSENVVLGQKEGVVDKSTLAPDFGGALLRAGELGALFAHVRGSGVAAADPGLRDCQGGACTRDVAHLFAALGEIERGAARGIETQAVFEPGAGFGIAGL